MPSKGRRRSLEDDRAIEDAVLDEVAEVCLAYNARVVTDQYRSAGVADYLRGETASALRYLQPLDLSRSDADA